MSYYRKESAAFLPHDLNAKICISKQFFKGKFTFDPMASFPRFIIGRMAGLNISLCFLHKFVSRSSFNKQVDIKVY
jgi:hypothetical protein